jgi:hypothetical protein
MFNTIKNKIIVSLIRKTHINVAVIQAVLSKVPYAEMESYMQNLKEETR